MTDSFKFLANKKIKLKRRSPGGMTSYKAVTSKRATLQILPCTVSQLLSASHASNDTFAICDWELNQVSVVGIVRGCAPFVTNIQYSVDDMTGPPLNVKQWVNTEDCAMMTFTPGTYVKVTGSLRNHSGQKSLLAMNIRRIKDLNEITSHMLEVVQAHKHFFGQAFDVNMNTTDSGRHPESVLPNGLSTIQDQVCGLKGVLHVIRRYSVRDDGICFHDLQKQLNCLSIWDIRNSLTFLVNEGHIYSVADGQHFKSTQL